MSVSQFSPIVNLKRKVLNCCNVSVDVAHQTARIAATLVWATGHAKLYAWLHTLSVLPTAMTTTICDSSNEPVMMMLEAAGAD